MDRRSWLWRRKSSPGETESSGGSVSSHSDDQVYLNQSPEVTSKLEQVEGGVQALSLKLSEALLNIGIKEDLVKQHSRVAEEAVEGWEKAENEVLALRQQLEALTLQNSTLKDRVGHLDGALKECLRQLRQTKEENDEAIEKKTLEWQMTKAELEKQVFDLRSQLQSAKQDGPFSEISALKVELASMAEELELRFIERELSNQAAEQANKLHLESVKKAAKFEAECQRLSAALSKALAANDQKVSQSIAAVEEFESNRSTPASEINLMDDFLEMERLVALPEKNQMSEAEEDLKRVMIEKQNVEMALSERENELKVAKSQLTKLEALLINANDARETSKKELESVKAIVNLLQERVKRSELEGVELKSQLDIERSEANYRLQKRMEAESRLAALEAEVGKKHALLGKLGARCRDLESELNSLNLNLEKEQARCWELEAELDSLVRKVDSLETKVEKERALSKNMGVKCHALEDEISKLQWHPNPEGRIIQDTEIELAATKFADCQKTIASLSRQLKTLATLEDLLIQPPQ